MRKIILLVALLMSLSDLAGQSQKSARYINCSDPEEQVNLDPNWNWTGCCSGYTMFYSPNGATPIRLNNVQLPFFANGNPLADNIDYNQRDMWPQDGWVLAYKDFGTSKVAPGLPFFALYNKYTGMFRVMIYNAINVSSSKFLMTLSFGNTSPKIPLFTFADTQKPYDNDFDPNKQLNYFSIASSLQDWFVADFPLVGYTPTIDPQTKLHLELYTVDESQINLKSTTFQLNGTIGYVGSGSPTLDAFNKGQKIVKGVDGVRKAAKDLVETTEKSGKKPNWLSGLKNLANSTVSNIIPFVSPVVDIITSFIGGGAANTMQPITLNGSLELEGKIITNRRLLQCDLALSINAPKVNNCYDPAFYYPLNNIPWGLFNISKPTQGICQDEIVTDYCDVFDPNNPYIADGVVTTCYGPSISYLTNPNTGMRLLNVQVAALYTFTFGGANFTNIQNVPNQIWDSYYYGGCYGWSSGSFATGMSVKFEFEIINPTKNYSKNITIFKTYTFGSGSGRRSFEKLDQKEVLTIYPNPFDEHVRILHGPFENTVKISFIDMTGRVVANVQNTNPKQQFIDWDGQNHQGGSLPTGLYIVKVFVDNRKPVITKILKK